MQAVGLIEISAGLLVAAKPKRGGYVVGGMAGRYCRQSLDEAGVSGHRIARHRSRAWRVGVGPHGGRCATGGTHGGVASIGGAPHTHRVRRGGA